MVEHGGVTTGAAACQVAGAACGEARTKVKVQVFTNLGGDRHGRYAHSHDLVYHHIEGAQEYDDA